MPDTSHPSTTLRASLTHLSLPLLLVIHGWFTAQGLVFAGTEGIASLNQGLDFRTAFINDRALRVAEIAFHIVFVAETIRAMDLNRFRRRAVGGLGGEFLGVGGLEVQRLPRFFNQPACK